MQYLNLYTNSILAKIYELYLFWMKCIVFSLNPANPPLAFLFLVIFVGGVIMRGIVRCEFIVVECEL